MNERILYFLAIVSASVFLLFSCAELQKQVRLDEGTKENTIEITASNFKFEPNNILTYESNTVLFRITNITISEHNFTLTDSAGTKLEDIDIPRDKTVEIKVTFSRPGIYHFYCDRPFHSAFGMKGQIEVVGR